MKTPLLALFAAFWSVAFTPVHAALAGFTSFEEPTLAASMYYTDSGDPRVDHALQNNPGEPPVNYLSVGNELGFTSVYQDTRGSGPGMTDGSDISGVQADLRATDGAQWLRISDPDGYMTTSLDSLSLSGLSNVILTLDLYVNATSWETSDRLRIWVSNNQQTELDLIDTQGLDIDDLNLESMVTSFSLDLAALGTDATLHFGLDSNSAQEWIAIDNVRFNAELSPVPLPGAAWFLLSAMVGLLLTGGRRVTPNQRSLV